MTKPQAAEILDLRRAGADIPPAVIDMALELTGDIARQHGIGEVWREIAEVV